MRLSNVPITFKILMCVVLMAFVSLFAAFYGAQQITAVDMADTAVIEGESAAARDLARANQRVFRLGDIAYRAFSRTDVAQTREVLSRIDTVTAEFRDRLDAVRKALPRTATELDRFSRDFDKVSDLAREINEIANAGDRDRARAELETRFDPALGALRDEMTAYMEKLIEDGHAASAAATELAHEAITTNYVVVLGATVIILAISTLLAVTAISRPLRGIADTMQRLAGGELTVDIVGRDRKDEVGLMARSVEVFKQNAIAVKALEDEQERAKVAAEADKRKAMNQLADSFEREVMDVVRSVAAAAEQLQQNANSMGTAAEETNRQSNTVAAASEQASVNVRTVAAAAEELSSSIAEIGQQVATAANVASKAPARPRHPAARSTASSPTPSASAKW
ncbi:HAMP domain-containing protein [Methylobrevis pamukkalensis]|uniref:HAMP domain protein n=1 Tax=Methylobrevis pamukkalensis TaxID=1439726 RepID=A0A1E3H9V2_9HYPH|nr:methyl-accepting chemotaxis protein [Methylobrevis pamukkalensis]ODN72261.1 HAMP domain protein [Methylobrevis pamukkalensis]